MTEVATCPDCGRPKAADTQDYYRSAYHGDGGYPVADRKCPAHIGPAHRYDCHELAITRLRQELSTLRSLGEAERAVVDASVEWRKWMLATGGDEMVDLVEMIRVVIAVDALLAERAKVGL